MTAIRKFNALSCSLLLATAGSAAAHAQQAAANVPPSIAPAAPEVVQPAAPPRPAEMSPNTPKVVCQGSTISVDADNSTMTSVIAAIRGCTGLKIELPEDEEDARTYLQIGPAPVREVLESLFSSTDFNYVIQASSTVPDKIESVLVMTRPKDEKDAKTGPSAPQFAMTPARRVWMESRRNGRPADYRGEDKSTPAADTTSSEDTADVEPSAAAAESSPPAPAATTSAAAAASTSAPAPASAPNTSASPAPAASAADTAAATTPAQDGAVAAVAEAPKTTPAENPLQDKITQMQQLFAQRKQMMSGQPPAQQ